jgi:ribosomal protein S27AE
MDTWIGGEGYVLRVNDGKRSFRCEKCGANVFLKHRDDPRRYKCNGCGATYTAEAEET